MSEIIIPFYRTEAGVNAEDPVNALYNTHCEEGSVLVPKSFKEVFIHWNEGPDVWVEDPVFVPGQSIVALKVTNPCDDTFAYIDYGFNDFRLDQLCCKPVPCPEITLYTVNEVGGQLPDATVGVPYNATIQILGPGLFSLDETPANIPVWMILTLDPETGLVTLSGTPEEEEEESNVNFYMNGCNRVAASDSPGSAVIDQLITVNPAP